MTSEEVFEENIETAKITIERNAEKTLSKMLEKVNEGFEAGRLNRQQLASWILIKFGDGLDEQQINEIRGDHFNEISLLENILKRGKESGQLPAELKLLLRQQMGYNSTQSKKPPRKLTKDYINDVVIKES